MNTLSFTKIFDDRSNSATNQRTGNRFHDNPSAKAKQVRDAILDGKAVPPQQPLKRLPKLPPQQRKQPQKRIQPSQHRLSCTQPLLTFSQQFVREVHNNQTKVTTSNNDNNDTNCACNIEPSQTAPIHRSDMDFDSYNPFDGLDPMGYNRDLPDINPEPKFK